MTTLPPQAEETAAALFRSDRYLREFVEALELCPYAKRCRETGQLHRRVVLAEGVPAALQAAREVEVLPAGSLEVALLIFPRFAAGPRAFDELCRQVREGLRDFFCVAFHPDLPEDLADEHRAVGFIRRSPDPTLQLVRASVLSQVRGARTGGSTFLDLGKLSLPELLAVASPLSVSEKIALANLATLQREGPGRARALLEELRKTRHLLAPAEISGINPREME